MKIGLYFGSFNPIHTGHLIIATHVSNYTNLQEIWFVISPQNPLKKSQTLLNEHQRKFLVDLAIEGEEKLRSSNIEFKLPKPSYTVDTLLYLNEKYPQHEFSIIIGSDSYLNLKRWKNYEVIINNYTLYVYVRPGFDLPPTLDQPMQKIIVLDQTPLLQISSTNIRKMVAEGKSISYLVPKEVQEEIEIQNYYKNNK
jgi:nicotinate-nucleotide adenylyltransferase